METLNERMRILEMIDRGQISAEEALQLLQALEEAPEPAAEESTVAGQETPAEAMQVATTPSPSTENVAVLPDSQNGQVEAIGASIEDSQAQAVKAEVLTKPRPPDFEKWRRFWVVPFWIGVVITAFGGMLMNWVLAATGTYGFWYFCSTLPLILGALIIFVAWQSRTAHWLHLRVQQAPGERPHRIALSFPLPLRASAWFIRTFRRWIPRFQETNIDEILMAVGESTTPENPLYIQVDEGEDGEKVEIFIG